MVMLLRGSIVMHGRIMGGVETVACRLKAHLFTSIIDLCLEYHEKMFFPRLSYLAGI